MKDIQEMLIGYWVPMEATTLAHCCHMARQYISGLGGILIVQVSLEYLQSFVMVSGMAPYTDCTVILALIQIFNLMTTSFGKSPLHAICWTQTHRDIQSHGWQPWGHPQGDQEEGLVWNTMCLYLGWGVSCKRGHGGSQRKWSKAGAAGVHGMKDASFWKNGDTMLVRPSLRKSNGGKNLCDVCNSRVSAPVSRNRDSHGRGLLCVSQLNMW